MYYGNWKVNDMSVSIRTACQNSLFSVLFWMGLESVFSLPLFLFGVFEYFDFNAAFIGIVISSMPLVLEYIILYLFGKKLLKPTHLGLDLLVQLLFFFGIGVIRCVVLDRIRPGIFLIFFATELPPLETIVAYCSPLFSGPSQNPLSQMRIYILSVFVSIVPALFICLGLRNNQKRRNESTGGGTMKQSGY